MGKGLTRGAPDADGHAIVLSPLREPHGHHRGRRALDDFFRIAIKVYVSPASDYSKPDRFMRWRRMLRVMPRR
jgi:hypothetical protein